MKHYNARFSVLCEFNEAGDKVCETLRCKLYCIVRVFDAVDKMCETLRC